MALRGDPTYKTKVCSRCLGDGVAEVWVDKELVEVDCPACQRTGYAIPRVEESFLFNEGVVRTYEILEATDITEYGNLSDSNKNAYNMILQCGIVDLTDGTQIRTNLWAMFDSESTTRANLITLLGE